MSDVPALGFSTIDSSGEYATKYSFFDTIQKHDPDIIIADGHGDPRTLTGQGLQEILRSCTNNEILSGRFVCATSCLTGQILGPDSRDKQAKAYTGWVNEFTWIVSPPYNPATDPAAQSFESIIRTLVTLMCRHQQGTISLRDVYDGTIAEFDRWEKYYSVPPGSEDPYAGDILISLRHDRNGLVTLGKEFYVGAPPISLKPLAPLAVGALALIWQFL